MDGCGDAGFDVRLRLDGIARSRAVSKIGHSRPGRIRADGGSGVFDSID